MKMQGSVALVTGANRGLGQALVAELLQAGAAKVYAAARDEKKLSVRDRRVVPLALDITKPESIAAAARTANDVTLLLNNAGVLTAYNVLTASQADLDADFRTNVYGTLNVIKAFIPVLEGSGANGAATIVNVLSLLSLASMPALGGYAASKAAAYSITLALRAELKAKRIDVLVALPGPTDTDMVKHLPIPKTSPGDTAKGIVAGIARGDEEIFPDPRAQQLGALWNESHKEYERAFASF
ncbi:MAG TPA: SDR family NAD(P)-dependent oxidoreductase [Polyangiaceae bacterium]|jgi:NAD(P)-dependent dehydrogenase (short-subunit alcohol dehydrogenase family)|nr:SDR family NAD(P)-dependent oxidoreductase [Polyangiaceae bacterium]